MQDPVAFLCGTDLLGHLPQAVLARIATGFTERWLGAGEALFREGEAGDAAYFVVSGSLFMEVAGKRLVERGAGACVGEFALIDEGPRSATAVAAGEVLVLRWERAAFQSALAFAPAVARGVLRLLTAKLREDVATRAALLAERERFAQDLARAREIQSSMLPPGCGSVNGIQVAAHCRPASGVGGDFFDYLGYPDGKVSVVVADVTGHGFYSSLFVAMAKSCLHTYTRFDRSPAGVVTSLRRSLALSIGGHLLMSCCYLLIDPHAGFMEYVNAGHPPVLHHRAGEDRVGALEALDPILGALDEDAPFTPATVPWTPHDTLLLCSDGLIEARSAGGEMLGLERLSALVARRAGAGAAPVEVRAAVLDALARHRAGTPVEDDLTLVVVGARAGSCRAACD